MSFLDKPKRPLSAFNLFFKSERKKILKEREREEDRATLLAGGRKRTPSSSRRHGKISFAELAQTVSARWKKIHPSTKQQFQALADVDKQRYFREKAAYIASNKKKDEGAGVSNILQKDEETAPKERAGAPEVNPAANDENKKKSCTTKPKRPLSAFNLFFKEQRKEILDALSCGIKGGHAKRHRRRHGMITFENLARTVAKRWASISPVEKERLQALAQSHKKQYVAQMEVWKQQQQHHEEEDYEEPQEQDRHQEQEKTNAPAAAKHQHHKDYHNEDDDHEDDEIMMILGEEDVVLLLANDDEDEEEQQQHGHGSSTNTTDNKRSHQEGTSDDVQGTAGGAGAAAPEEQSFAVLHHWHYAHQEEHSGRKQHFLSFEAEERRTRQPQEREQEDRFHLFLAPTPDDGRAAVAGAGGGFLSHSFVQNLAAPVGEAVGQQNAVLFGQHDNDATGKKHARHGETNKPEEQEDDIVPFVYPHDDPAAPLSSSSFSMTPELARLARRLDEEDCLTPFLGLYFA